MATGYLDLAYMAEFALVFNLTLKELEIKPLITKIESLKDDLEAALEKTKKIELSRDLLVSINKNKDILKLNDESCNNSKLKDNDKKICKFAKRIKEGKASKHIKFFMYIILITLFSITIANHYAFASWLNNEGLGNSFQISWWIIFISLASAIIHSIKSIKKTKQVKDYFFNSDNCVKVSTLQCIAEINNLVKINNQPPTNGDNFI